MGNWRRLAAIVVCGGLLAGCTDSQQRVTPPAGSYIPATAREGEYLAEELQRSCGSGLAPSAAASFMRSLSIGQSSPSLVREICLAAARHARQTKMQPAKPKPVDPFDTDWSAINSDYESPDRVAITVVVRGESLALTIFNVARLLSFGRPS